MLDKKDEELQLEAIKMLHHTVYILVKFVHQLWDSPYMETDVKSFCMGLYGELMTQIFPPIHRLMRDLELEYEIMYNGEVSKDDEGDFLPE
jgi:hypothetical protein